MYRFAPKFGFKVLDFIPFVFMNDISRRGQQERITLDKGKGTGKIKPSTRDAKFSAQKTFSKSLDFRVQSSNSTYHRFQNRVIGP